MEVYDAGPLRDRRAAGQRDELAPFHSITSSARRRMKASPPQNVG
jgi:hypothetical protein